MNLDLKHLILFNTVGSILISLGLYIISRHYLGQIRKIKRWIFIVLIQYAICGIIMGVRASYYFYWTTDSSEYSAVQDVSYALVLLSVILIPFGFLLICIDLFIIGIEFSDEKLKKLTMGIEQSPSSVIITDTSGTIEYVNPSFSEITGYLPQEVIGKNPRILKSGYTSREEYKEIWKKISSGERWKGIFQNKKKNGELYWEATSISPLKNHQGKIMHFIAIKENITAQIIAERKLAESEEKHRLLMQTSTDLIHITDIRGNLLDYNSAFLKHLGYTEEEARSLKVNDWDAQWTAQQLKEVIENLIQTPRIFETIHKKKDGTLRNVEL